MQYLSPAGPRHTLVSCESRHTFKMAHACDALLFLRYRTLRSLVCPAACTRSSLTVAVATRAVEVVGAPSQAVCAWLVVQSERLKLCH